MATDARGFWDRELVAAYLTDYKEEKERDPRYEEEEVDSWRDPKTLQDPLPSVVLGPDGRANLSLPVNECLCLDVGCWAGNGAARDAAKGDEHNHPRHRDFGVVCGNVAAERGSFLIARLLKRKRLPPPSGPGEVAPTKYPSLIPKSLQSAVISRGRGSPPRSTGRGTSRAPPASRCPRGSSRARRTRR